MWTCVACKTLGACKLVVAKGNIVLRRTTTIRIEVRWYFQCNNTIVFKDDWKRFFVEHWLSFLWQAKILICNIQCPFYQLLLKCKIDKLLSSLTLSFYNYFFENPLSCKINKFVMYHIKKFHGWSTNLTCYFHPISYFS